MFKKQLHGCTCKVDKRVRFGGQNTSLTLTNLNKAFSRLHRAHFHLQRNHTGKFHQSFHLLFPASRSVPLIFWALSSVICHLSSLTSVRNVIRWLWQMTDGGHKSYWYECLWKRLDVRNWTVKSESYINTSGGRKKQMKISLKFPLMIPL